MRCFLPRFRVLLSCLLSPLLVTAVSGSAFALPAPQTTESGVSARPMLPTPEAAKPSRSSTGDTVAMATVETVSDRVTVSAGLLPKESARALFGGWVADRFAVVHVVFENHSPDQQFQLEKIEFDYTDWALSGAYGTLAPPTGLTAQQKANQPGFVTTESALHVQNALKSAAVFSPRNLVVNGLVAIGTAAGGFAFLGPIGFQQAVTGYTSDVIPALQKFWPDRAIDQQSNLLTYGFRGEIVVGMGKAQETYAFFPYDAFLTPGLKKVFLESPALFLNPAEALIDPSTERRWIGRKTALKNVKEMLAAVLASQNVSPQNALKDLVAECTIPVEGRPSREDCTGEPLLVKTLMQRASLHATRIVVEGEMTQSTAAIPAYITGLTIDPKVKSAAFWTFTAPQAGESAAALHAAIAGKYLSNGTPEFQSIEVPGDAAANLDDYVDTSSVKVASEGASDTLLPFTFSLKKTLPTGTKLGIAVVKKDASGTVTESMVYAYTVTYAVAAEKAGSGQ